MSAQDQLRELPSVDHVATALARLDGRFPRKLIVEETRRVLSEMRVEIRAGRPIGPQLIEERVERNLLRLETPSLRRVINATGVVLHTNLGRAPLPRFDPLPGYSNLEYDLESGGRGQRDTHVAELIERLAGAPGIAVNNNAAAIYLALNELAAGHEVVVSRGELIEIGDGFRIPDIMRASGAVLREIGTTNRTTLEDYRAAINERTRLLLRVHPSNFRISGFTAKPELRALAEMARQHGIPLYEDLGSGCVVNLRRFGIDEPLVADSLRAGVSLVSFSGDKLLGGPQAGVLAGDAELVKRLRRNPLFRVLRLDKLIYQALETTLRLLLLERWECIPALAMIGYSAAGMKARSDCFVRRLDSLRAKVVPGHSVIGGGSTPEQPLETWVIAIEYDDVVAIEKRLRAGEPPVIARIEDGLLIADLRTVFAGEEEELARSLKFQ